MVHALPHRDLTFRWQEVKDGSCPSGSRQRPEQEICRKTPVWYTGPAGGVDLISFGPADKPVHKQCIRNPVWNGWKNDTGTACACCLSSGELETVLWHLVLNVVNTQLCALSTVFITTKKPVVNTCPFCSMTCLVHTGQNCQRTRSNLCTSVQFLWC